MNIHLTPDQLRLVRRSLTIRASEEWLNRADPARSHECKLLDQLLDALPEPLDELTLGGHPDPHEAAALMEEWHAEQEVR